MLFVLKDAQGATIRQQEFQKQPPDPIGKGWSWSAVVEPETVSVATPPISLPYAKQQAKSDLDVACGVVRASVTANGVHVSEEYRRAYEGASAFSAGGYSGTAPASVQSWADAKGQSAQWAADDIIATRNQFMALIDAVRDVRLKGKAAIDAAADVAAVGAALTVSLTQLSALQP